MDLGHQILSRYPSVIRSDRSCTKFTIGLQPSAYQDEDKKVETLQVSKCREDLDHLLTETRGGDHGIGSRDIDIPVDRRSGKSTLKTLGITRTVHQGRMRGSNRSHREKSDKEVVYRWLSHRDIRDPGEKVFVHFGIMKPETPTGRKVPPWGQLSANQRVGI
jgi:hypothetical protein